MATQILSYAPARLIQGPEAYSANMYQGYPNYSNYSSSQQSEYVAENDHQPATFVPQEGWIHHSNSLRKMSSRSPSAQHDRTPIRHHRQSLSRPRSISKPDALMAYANDQSVQSHPISTPSTIAQTTPSSSPGIFQPQTYSTMSPATPYIQHPAYYAGASPHFSDLQGPPSARSHEIPDYYQMNRSEMHLTPMTSSNMSPSNPMFVTIPGQTTPSQMSALSSRSLTFSSLPPTLESTPGGIEISSSRNKPQCWDHGCNGRQFSTFSNLLRHQREKSGTAQKSRCPHCNTEFTRTTARNGHMYGGKCKGMADSSRRSSSAGDDQSEK